MRTIEHVTNAQRAVARKAGLVGLFLVLLGSAVAYAKVPGDIVETAIACSTNHVYAWYTDLTASSGTSTDLDKYRAPYRYSYPAGKAIVGIGISNNDIVTAWYSDGTR